MYENVADEMLCGQKWLIRGTAVENKGDFGGMCTKMLETVFFVNSRGWIRYSIDIKIKIDL